LDNKSTDNPRSEDGEGVDGAWNAAGAAVAGSVVGSAANAIISVAAGPTTNPSTVSPAVAEEFSGDMVAGT
jgi:hypothetical protein